MTEADVEKLRYTEGKKAANKGQGLHRGASKEFTEGYKSSTWGGGSNVMPRHFGKGGAPSTDWECQGCGAENRRYLVQCGMCGIRRSLSDQIGETDGPE